MEIILGLIFLFFMLGIFSKKENKSLSNTTKAVGFVGKKAIRGAAVASVKTAKYTSRVIKNQMDEPSTRYGSARFLTAKESKKLLNARNVGLSINGTVEKTLSQENAFKHLLLVAPSGAGKTVSYVIPSILLQMHRGGSIVVTDPSGEIFEKTSGFARQQGYSIKIFNVSDVLKSFSYNPIEHAKNHRDIAYLASILVESAFESTSANSFWNDGASTIIELLIRLLKKQQGDFANLANVRHLLNQFGVDGSALLPLFVQTGDGCLLSEYTGFVNQESKILHGFLSTAKTALRPFSESSLCQLTARDNLNFRTIREESTIFYISCKEALIPHYKFIFKILYSQLFSFFMEDLSTNKQPIYVYMDEFGNLGKLNNFDTILTTVRKYGVSVSLILQDIQQLTNVYGKQKASIIMNGGISSKLFLPGMSVDDCKLVEQLLGQATVEDINFWTQEKEAAYGRVLLTAQEIRIMEKGTGIFIHGNELPIKLEMVPYFSNKKLNALTVIQPILIPSIFILEVEYLPLLPINNTSSSDANDEVKFPDFDL